MSRERSVIVFVFVLLTGCSTFAGPAAPESCGFPDGTALSYAGRSTTAALGVQEVVGDPLSHDPADIYITRDAFDQGELHGRLVCAIFVGPASFVEVTVHPADGGRFPEEPAPNPEPSIYVQGVLSDVQVGVANPFDIVTEYCGLRGANINGEWWVEEGALQDGEFPTSGFDAPVDSGTIRLLDRDVAEYRSETGIRFTFIRASQALVDQLPICFD